MTTKELEYAINKHYFNSAKIITTKLSRNSGVVSHECDVVVVTNSYYLIEFELKISKSDLKKDFQKKHSHECDNIKKTFYVIPEKLEDCIELIPERFGIIIVNKKIQIDKSGKIPLEKTYYPLRIIREAQTNKKAKKITNDNFIKICTLASMRYWTTKENELKRDKLIIWQKAKICDNCQNRFSLICRNCDNFNNWEDKE
ncbi:hypothetical protein MKD34_12190 (plasmid) [Cetobacterium somerae]|uniref:hypothetical protein n=1 Tax=Cetobacterium somerae TaxID=188913 RepID=UPI001F05A100|nr:hypothetical protein [Cetobacterium somerae]UPO98387.1 hypothetical protein MKD34_12190 [Cetobacterium somerae]